MTTFHNTSHPPRRTLSSWLLGKPLSTHEAPHQTISKTVGLAVFASDALSSSAYCIDEILIVLILAGTGTLWISMPIALAIMILLAILTTSYEQTIHAYPGGGGAYIVARDNLGELQAQTAGAALLTDYILTVAVSISSGVLQITSAFPVLYDYRVPIALALIAFMTLINLRGVKESGVTFAVPTYFFLGMVLLTIGVGGYQYFTGTLGRVVPESVEVVHHGETLQALTLFLILRAFAGGCTALTGVEAISNGITAFKEPKSHNAGLTLMWMGGILAVNLFGLTFLANQIGVLPSHLETGFSQIGRVVYGRENPMYLALLASTTLILIMAANTAYADFPRLGALQASDGFLPRQLTYRGSRLVFTYGITGLAVCASVLIIIFQAQVTALIPLYAIGVFLSFTLSQTGMAVRWWRSSKLKAGEEIVQQGGVVRYDPHWRLKILINSLGAVVTAVVMVVFAVTKFPQGAWVIVILIPTLIIIFFRIHHHYKDVARDLSLEDFGAPARVRRNRVLIPMGGVHRGMLHALRYARSLSEDVTALYVAADLAETDKVKKKWETWGDGIRLVVIESPYRRLIEPLIEYVDRLSSDSHPQEMLTIVVPQFVPAHWWQKALHMNTAQILREALLRKSNIVVMDVPYHIGD